MIKKFFMSSAFKRFCWVALNSFIGSLVVYLTGLDWKWAIVIIPALNNVTKWINDTYLQKAEVLKKVL